MHKLLDRLRASLGRNLRHTERPLVAYAETLGIVLVFLALGASLTPEDPLGLRAAFPWGWFAPALLALRQGTLPALFGILLLGAGHAMIAPLPMHDQHLHAHVVGGLFLTLLLGEFSGIWRSRLRRELELSGYIQEQLQVLTREYYMLRLSHERLEQELLLRPGSLGEALDELDRGLRAAAPDTPLPEAGRLLQLLGEYARLESAALYPVDETGQPWPEPAATLGKPRVLDAADRLIRIALEERRLSHVAELDEDSRFLVAAPILSSRRLHGLLVVSDMPFLALEQKNLLTLSLILTDYAELMERERVIGPLSQDWPDCPPDFAFALHRLWRTRETAGIASSLVTLLGPRNRRVESLFEQLLAHKRTLDLYWLRREKNALALHILLPLGSRQQAAGLLQRIETLLMEQYGARLEDWRVQTDTVTLDLPPADLLERLAPRQQAASAAPANEGGLA